MKSIELLIELIKTYYAPFRSPENIKSKIVWLSAFAPVELFLSMGMHHFYPESYAAVCSAHGMAEELIHKSNQAHLSDQVCSYASIVWGAVRSGKGYLENLPKPDFLISTNNQCGTTLFFWKVLSQYYQRPLYHINLPRFDGSTSNDFLPKFIIGQFRDMLENISNRGFSFSDSKFEETLSFSAKTVEYWKRIQEFLLKGRISIQQVYDSIFPIVTMRGTEIGMRYYETLVSEIEHDSARFVLNKYLKNIVWYGYPFWFTRPNLPDLSKIGGQITYSNYPFWWILDYSGGDPFSRLARAIQSTYLNKDILSREGEMLDIISNNRVDGVVIHMNKSCKRDAIGDYSLRNLLKKKKIPVCMIEGDMCNPEYYNKATIMNRLESFIETL